MSDQPENNADKPDESKNESDKSKPKATPWWEREAPNPAYVDDLDDIATGFRALRFEVGHFVDRGPEIERSVAGWEVGDPGEWKEHWVPALPAKPLAKMVLRELKIDAEDIDSLIMRKTPREELIEAIEEMAKREAEQLVQLKCVPLNDPQECCSVSLGIFGRPGFVLVSRISVGARRRYLRILFENWMADPTPRDVRKAVDMVMRYYDDREPLDDEDEGEECKK